MFISTGGDESHPITRLSRGSGYRGRGLEVGSPPRTSRRVLSFPSHSPVPVGRAGPGLPCVVRRVTADLCPEGLPGTHVPVRLTSDGDTGPSPPPEPPEAVPSLRLSDPVSPRLLVVITALTSHHGCPPTLRSSPRPVPVYTFVSITRLLLLNPTIPPGEDSDFFSLSSMSTVL